MNDFDYLLQLPGEEREREWIRARLETLTARENILLTAATQKQSPQNTVEAINQIESLVLYWAACNTGSLEQLGEYYMKECCKMPEAALPFTDLTKVGSYFADRNPGQFIGDFYVTDPEFTSKPAYHGPSDPLPDDGVWGFKLKLASPAVPEGVWMRLPGMDCAGNIVFIEEDVTKHVLQVQDWDECSLLDAQCILPGISAQDLMERYGSTAELVEDSFSLSRALLYEWTSPSARYTAALELENCHDLKLALDIFHNLDCYDWVPLAEQKTLAQKALTDARIPEELIASGAIDLDRYGAQMLKEQGYTLAADESGYITRNSQEFQHYFSTPTSEQSGMMMQY